MLRKTCGLALALALLGGCDNGEDVTDEVNSPSEGARIENENPTTPTVDVPGTPANEAAEANAPAETAPTSDMPDVTAPTPGTPGDEAPAPAPGVDNTPESPAPEASAGNSDNKEPTIVSTPASATGGDENAGEKTLEDADAAAKSGGDATPKD